MLRKLNGYIPSSPDNRDYSLDMYSLSSDGEKPVRHTITDLPPVFNQGKTGTCVANGLASRIARNQFKETGQWIDYSRTFIYAQKMFKEAEGMIPRVALSRVMKLGTVRADRFEVLDSVDKIMQAYNEWKKGFVNWESMIELSRYNRFESFARLTTDDEIKTVLLQDKMVGIGIHVRRNFDRPREDGFIAYNKDQPIRGGHWIEIVGYDDEKGAWLVQNSWGEDWGIDGRAWLDYDYPLLESWNVFDYKPEAKKTELVLELNNHKAILNGEEFDLRVAPFLKKYSEKYSATCTELRPIFEKLGYKVATDWTDEKKLVFITED